MLFLYNIRREPDRSVKLTTRQGLAVVPGQCRNPGLGPANPEFKRQLHAPFFCLCIILTYTCRDSQDRLPICPGTNGTGTKFHRTRGNGTRNAGLFRPVPCPSLLLATSILGQNEFPWSTCGEIKTLFFT